VLEAGRHTIDLARPTPCAAAGWPYTATAILLQPQETLGWKLEKMPEVRVFSGPVTVRLEVSGLDEWRAHADRGELMEWLKPPAAHLKNEPSRGESFPLDP